MTNQTLEAIFNRRSVRAYTDEAVSDEITEVLAKAALASPSSMNSQPWRVIAVKNKELILEMERAVADYFTERDPAVAERIRSRGGKVFYNASTVFFLALQNNAKADNIGIMSENICIAATSVGLGSIILGLPRVIFEDPATADFWKGRLGFPEGFEYGLAVAVGYADGEGKPHEPDMSKLSYIR